MCLAHGALPPNYPPVKKRLSVLAKGARATGAQRKKAIVAVARHLAVDLWRLHTGRCTAEQLGLKIQKVSSRGTEKQTRKLIKPFGTWRVPESNLNRDNMGLRRFRLDRAPFRFTETE